jgi:hypothetical protein
MHDPQDCVHREKFSAAHQGGKPNARIPRIPVVATKMIKTLGAAGPEGGTGPAAASRPPAGGNCRRR